MPFLHSQRNVRRLGRLHDGGGLVVGHAVNHVQAALGGEAREQLTGDALSDVGRPLGVLDGDDLGFRIGLERLAEPDDTAWPDALLQAPVMSATLPPSRPPSFKACSTD